MALYANYPIAIAPGMGLNAYFAYIVVGAMGLPVTNVHYWAARGLGAYRDGTRLSVSGVSQVTGSQTRERACSDLCQQGPAAVPP